MTVGRFMLLTAEILSEKQEVEKQLGILQSYVDVLPEKILSLGIRVMLALVLFAVGSRAIAFLRRFVRRTLEKFSTTREAVQFLDSCLRAFLYVVLVFMILQLFGLEATSIATVIGSVGVTVGLAVQGSLTNCIGGILILTLKPFKVGDFIIEDTNKNEGVVQEITIFYTKLVTFDNKVIWIPNGTLANSSMTNVTDNPERRVDLTIGISYRSDIRQARRAVERAAAAHPLVLQDREVFVYVENYAASRIVLGIRVWAKRENWWTVRCDLMEQIKYAFDEDGIEIPPPQMDVRIVKDEMEGSAGE